MRHYVSRPVVIQAMQWDGTYAKAREILHWANNGQAWKSHVAIGLDEDGVASMNVLTLEGIRPASHGDWIIKGTIGEFYPCKPAVFEKKYEPLTLVPGEQK